MDFMMMMTMKNEDDGYEIFLVVKRWYRIIQKEEETSSFQIIKFYLNKMVPKRTKWLVGRVTYFSLHFVVYYFLLFLYSFNCNLSRLRDLHFVNDKFYSF